MAELTKGDAYTCPIMANPRDFVRDEPVKGENKKARTFLFNVTKGDLIFDKLYKDKQIKLRTNINCQALSKLRVKNIVNGIMHGHI